MRTLRKRETFIALRARRQGYRIAREYLDPPMRCPAAKWLDPGVVTEYRIYVAAHARAAEKETLEERAKRQALVSWAVILLCFVSVIIAWGLSLHYRPAG